MPGTEASLERRSSPSGERLTVSILCVQARVLTGRRGPKNYAAEDSESIREQAGRHYNSVLSIASPVYRLGRSANVRKKFA